MTLTTDLVTQFLAARRAGTPIATVWSADPAASIEGLAIALGDVPLVQWDLVRGALGLNAKGVAAVKAILPKGVTDEAIPALTGVPTDMLRLAIKLPNSTVLFMLNLQRYWGENAPDVVQALWNLRDPFKATKRTVVGIGPDGVLPKELEHDVTVFTEPLPGRADLEAIILTLIDATNEALAAVKKPLLTRPEGVELSRIVDAMSGLSAFAAEQVCATSIGRDGIDVAAVRRRRQRQIENTPGLSIYKGSETFADLGGLRQLTAFFNRVKAKAREPIKAIAFIDELDKAMAGTGTAGGPGDSSGVSQDALKVLLTSMQDNNSQGCMLYGVPGAGKTAFAKALANELGVELIMWDLGGMQASLVGQSQSNVRTAAKVTNAVGQGNVLYVATCNGTATIPTELRRRFRTFGEWFFDLPAADETPAIAKIYLERYGLTPTETNPLPDLKEWTGAEIKSLCYLAYDLDLPFTEAAQFVVPMVTSAPEVVAKLRGQAEGKFLSVSDTGFYCAEKNQAARPKRAITLEDVVEASVAGRMIGDDLRKMKES